MTLKVKMANGTSDSVDFINDAGTTLAQIKGIDGTSSNGSVTIHTTASGVSSEKVRVDKDGNVGIGTSSPGTALTLGNNKVLSWPNDAGNYNGSTTGAQILKFSDNNVYFDNLDASTSIIFRRNGGTESMRIDSSGNLLVGTTTANGILTVKSASSTSSTYGISVANSAGTNLFSARSDGFIFTGTAASSPYNNTSASSANLIVGSDGSLGRSTSSLKYKTNVQDAIHGLSDLLNLRAVTYEGKAESDAGKTFGGLIAEEVHAAGLTEFVQYADDGTPDALAYGNMVSLCIKAIQELNAKVEAQAAEIAQLKGTSK